MTYRLAQLKEAEANVAALTAQLEQSALRYTACHSELERANADLAAARGVADELREQLAYEKEVVQSRQAALKEERRKREGSERVYVERIRRLWKMIEESNSAADTAERQLNDPGTTHYEGCWQAGPKHYQCAVNRVAQMEECFGSPQFTDAATHCVKCGAKSKQYRVKNGNPFCFNCDKELRSHVIDD